MPPPDPNDPQLGGPMPMPGPPGPGMPGMPMPGMPGDPMADPMMDPMAGAIPGPPAQNIGMDGPSDPTAVAPPPPPMPMEEPDDLKPIYPFHLTDRVTKELKKPRKPSQAFVDAAILDDQSRYQGLIERFREDLRTYRMHDRTVFDDLAIDDMEMFVSAEPAIQTHKVCNMISAIDHVIQFYPGSQPMELSAQRLENAAYHILDRANIAHRLAGNNDMKWDLLYSSMVFGRMVTRVLPDPTDPDMLVDIQVYDPATVFPTFGGKKGLVRVSSIYMASLDKIIQLYGDDDKVNKKLIKKYTNEEDKLNLGFTGEVREYWDEWYRYVEFDGEEVLKLTEHSIGRVPWVYTVGAGQMGSANMPGGGGTTAIELSTMTPLQSLGADMDLTQKGLSFFHHIRPALRQQAAILGITMTRVKQDLNPPVAKVSPYPKSKNVSMKTGDTNWLLPGEEIVPLLARGNPVDTGALLSTLDGQIQKGGLPNQLFGAMDGSNISGFAMESMVTAAKDRVQPLITDLEFHLEEILDLCFYHFRNMGHIFVDDMQGRWYIPKHGRDNKPALGTGPKRPEMQEVMGMLMQMTGGMPDLGAWHTQGLDNSQIEDPEDEDGYLTREDVINVGTRPEIKLRSMHAQNMTSMANVAAMLIDKKIWSRGTAMDEFNVKNPQDEWQKILAEDAQTHPKMMELVMFPEALFRSGDMSGFLAYYATVIAPILMQMQMGGMDPTMGGGPPPPGPGGPQTAQGDSQPMVGQSQQSLTGPGNAGSPPMGM